MQFQIICFLLFIGVFMVAFAVGGRLTDESPKPRKRQALRSNADWVETYKLANQLAYREFLRQEAENKK